MTRYYNLLIALVSVSRVAMAQDPTPGIELPTDARSPMIAQHGGFIGIPVVRSSPQLGFGVGAVGAYSFSIDSASPKSAVGAGGVYSDTRSWLFAVGSRVYWNAGTRDGAAGAAFFGLRYDFFGIGFDAGNAGESVPISQNGDAQMIELLGRLIGRFYVGPRYLHRGVTTSLRETNGPPALTQLAQTNNDYNISALGVEGNYDTRDEQNSPTRGTLSEVAAMFARGWLGTDPQFNWYRGWINQYIALSSHDAVLALRLTGCSVGASAPVWELCMYGLQSDLRGYPGGRYRDKTMFSTQAEFRIPIVDRFGAVAFGGVGAVASSFSAVAMDQLLPAGGVGLRYLVFESYRVRIGADVAWGRNGAEFYLRLGEAY